jgi:hypothetical protein
MVVGASCHKRTPQDIIFESLAIQVILSGPLALLFHIFHYEHLFPVATVKRALNRSQRYIDAG